MSKALLSFVAGLHAAPSLSSWKVTLNGAAVGLMNLPFSFLLLPAFVAELETAALDWSGGGVVGGLIVLVWWRLL